MISLKGLDLSAAFVLVLSAMIASILLVGAQSIAPPFFDPVGSAAVPRACGFALLLIGLLVFIQSLRAKPTENVGAKLQIRPATIGTMALMASYILGMSIGLGFILSTIIFVTAVVPLVNSSLKSAPVGICLAILLGLGANWLFTDVFFVDLPVLG